MSAKPVKASDAHKPWMQFQRKKDPYRRTRTPEKIFLIVCEGENTEVAYFESFRSESIQVKAVHGQSLKGEGKKGGLVNYALKLAKEPDFSSAELWCVFDYDIERGAAHVQPHDFNTAVAMGTKPGSKVQIAWSNDCFELWFLLHYQNLQTALERDDYYKRLKKVWNLKSFSREAKTLDFCMTIYARLEQTGDQQRAIVWARKQDEDMEQQGLSYHLRLPCTTVYKLVEELNRHLEK